MSEKRTYRVETYNTGGELEAQLVKMGPKNKPPGFINSTQWYYEQILPISVGSGAKFTVIWVGEKP
jgi:hypothetical protein